MPHVELIPTGASGSASLPSGGTAGQVLTRKGTTETEWTSAATAINVQTYCPKNTATEDCTKGFKEAFEAGSAVFAPTGEYLFGKGETIVMASKTLFGAGPGRTILKVKNTSSNLFACTGGPVQISELTIEQTSDITALSGIMVFAHELAEKRPNKASTFVMHHVDFIRPWIGTEVKRDEPTSYVTQAVIENCNFFLVRKTCIIGEGPNLLTIAKCFGEMAVAKVPAIKLKGCAAIAMSKVNFEKGEPVCILESCELSHFEDCFFDEGEGATIELGGGCVITGSTGLQFVNCWFNGSAGMRVASSVRVSFVNCEFSTCAAGAYVKATAAWVSFDDCDFTNNVTAGCLIEKGATDFSITNCRTAVGARNLQEYGIKVEKGHSVRYVITGNMGHETTYAQQNLIAGVLDEGEPIMESEAFEELKLGSKLVVTEGSAGFFKFRELLKGATVSGTGVQVGSVVEKIINDHELELDKTAESNQTKKILTFKSSAFKNVSGNF